MTRWSKALERALLVPAGAVRTDEPGARQTSPEDVVRTWHFDAEQVPATVPATMQATTVPATTVPSATNVKNPDAALLRCAFPNTVLDKLVVGEWADAGLVEQYRRVAAVMHH